MALERVPGDLERAPEPRVAATAEVGTRVSLTEVMEGTFVLTTMSWPEMRAPGAWPVLMVVTPRSRSHFTRGSRPL